MRYYPVLLDLEGKRCSVVGGGSVAARKVKTLLKTRASVWVISPVLCRDLSRLLRRRRIRHIRSVYQKKFLKNSFLVIAATNNAKINAAVWRDGQRDGILINVVDAPLNSNFIVPAVIAKQGLIISISTSGKAPCLAKKMRQELSKKIIPGYLRALKLVEKVRKNLKSSTLQCAKRKSILSRLVNSDLLKKKTR